MDKSDKFIFPSAFKSPLILCWSILPKFERMIDKSDKLTVPIPSTSPGLGVGVDTEVVTVGVGGVVLPYSNAPISKPLPNGRTFPSKSKEGASVDEPVLIAGELAWRRKL